MYRHTCVNDLAFCVQIIQCMKCSLKDKGQDWGRQSSGWVAMQKVPYTFKQREVDQTPVLVIWAINLKAVNQRSDSAAANMVLGACFDAPVHVDFVV